MTQEHLEIARELLDLCSFTELVAVLGGAKPAMRGTCSGEQVETIRDLARGLGLAAEVSSYALRVEEACGGVVHSWRPVPEGEALASDPRHFYIGADALAAQLAAIFGDSDPARFGATLGYPPCCTQFFLAQEPRQRPGRPFDLVPDVALPTGGRYTPLLNIACRHFGYALISHFPCHWDCEASQAVAEGVRGAVHSYDPELCAEIMDCLDTDVIYALPHVVAVKQGGWREGRLRLEGVTHWRVPPLAADEVEAGPGGLRLLLEGEAVAALDEWTWLPFQTGQVAACGGRSLPP